MRQYASDEVKVAWFGLVRLEDGLARGTYIRESRANPQWQYKADGMGDAIPMYFPNTNGFITLSFDRESRQHIQLTSLANADRATRSIVGPLYVTDKTSGLVQLYNKARLAGRPNYLTGTGPSVVPWVFLYAQSEGQTFGTDNNMVGS
jgi:hypothetical protein